MAALPWNGAGAPSPPHSSPTVPRQQQTLRTPTARAACRVRGVKRAKPPLGWVRLPRNNSRPRSGRPHRDAKRRGSGITTASPTVPRHDGSRRTRHSRPALPRVPPAPPAQAPACHVRGGQRGEAPFEAGGRDFPGTTVGSAKRPPSSHRAQSGASPLLPEGEGPGEEERTMRHTGRLARAHPPRPGTPPRRRQPAAFEGVKGAKPALHTKSFLHNKSAACTRSGLA